MKMTLEKLIAGSIIFAFGAVFLWLEYHPPPSHTIHVCVFTGIASFGLLVMFGDVVLPQGQKLIVVLQQTNLPYVGGAGRRKDDPPPPAGPPTGGTA